ncbi:MAG: hypothetical protein LBG79_05920 [Spirochaetaceae bacterium]|nr:hypothetical protein [Spirochaetaceae bacterium]GMO20828.1 MAG: hypothetical protein Pg6A_07750 [Termitinemataceae bacterium]
MKKNKIAALAAALFIAGTAEVYSLGLGVQFGGGLFGTNAALLISPSDDMHFAISWNFYKDGGYLGLSGDYWVWEPKLTKVGSGALNFFIGPGFYVNLGFTDPMILDLGLRLPLGLDLKFKKFDLFLQAAPSIGIEFLPKFALGGGGFFCGAIGARFWF